MDYPAYTNCNRDVSLTFTTNWFGYKTQIKLIHFMICQFSTSTTGTLAFLDGENFITTSIFLVLVLLYMSDDLKWNREDQKQSTNWKVLERHNIT